jgi:hypothetical protein
MSDGLALAANRGRREGSDSRYMLFKAGITKLSAVAVNGDLLVRRDNFRG